MAVFPGSMAASVAFIGLGHLRPGPAAGRGPDLESVTAEEIESHIRFLSDDLLEGRAVGSEGIGIAERYQEDLFRTFGLEPLFGSSYRQAFEPSGDDARPRAQAWRSSPTRPGSSRFSSTISSSTPSGKIARTRSSASSSIAVTSSRPRSGTGTTSRAPTSRGRSSSARSTSPGTSRAASSTART